MGRGAMEMRSKGVCSGSPPVHRLRSAYRSLLCAAHSHAGQLTPTAAQVDATTTDRVTRYCAVLAVCRRLRD